MIIDNLSQRTKNTLQALRGLPIHIGYDTSLSGPYVAERKTIKTEKQLKAFTKRWVSVWKLPWIKNWSMSDAEKQIVSGRYNAKEVLRCIIRNSSERGCSHVIKDRHCISEDILVPALLLRLLNIRTSFGITDGLAIIQLTRILHKDLNERDPEDFISYVNEHRSHKLFDIMGETLDQ